MEARIPEYWMVDPDQRAVTVVRPEGPRATMGDTVIWQPAGAAEPLEICLDDVFGA